MAKRTEGFDEAILQQAKLEFLKNGYEKASLRTIAQNADVSTSAIYTRFKDKEGLFRELLRPAAEKLLNYMETYLGQFEALNADFQACQRLSCAERGYGGFLDILYEYFDEFKLLVTSSTNGIYRSYLEKIVALHVNCTIQFLEVSQNAAYREGQITEGFIYILSSSFYSGLFELAVHNICREESEQYFNELKDFYERGWSRYLK